MRRVGGAPTGRSARRGRQTRTRQPNVHAASRFAVVPVDTDGDEVDDVAYITKGKTRREAIREVAREVADDAQINVTDTRTFRTKKAAQEQAAQAAPTTIELIARRLARGRA